MSFTSLEYAGDSILFVGTSTGKVSAWDTRKNSCFMHWEADTHEIGRDYISLFYNLLDFALFRCLFKVQQQYAHIFYYLFIVFDLMRV